jgi:CBS domain-containing protein
LAKKEVCPMRRQISDVMTREVVAVTPRTGYRDLVELFAGQRVTGAPVVDDSGAVVGVVSESDLLPKVARRSAPAGRRRAFRWRRPTRAAKAAGLVARDLMTTPAVTVSPSASLAAAAAIMTDHRVNRLPVVDDAGRPVGIVSRIDLLACQLRADAAIRRDVAALLTNRLLNREIGTLRTTVDQGVVHLVGHLGGRTAAKAAAALAATVEGVVDVQNEIDYDIDDTMLSALAQGRRFPSVD